MTRHSVFLFASAPVLHWLNALGSSLPAAPTWVGSRPAGGAVVAAEHAVEEQREDQDDDAAQAPADDQAAGRAAPAAPAGATPARCRG